MMLTGDHLLTSIATFKELNIKDKEFLILECFNEEIIGKNL